MNKPSLQSSSPDRRTGSPVDLMEKHPDEKPVFISGKDVRATLQKGEMVDPRIMRESTSEILAAAMKQA